jgi:hypothetical protein
MFCVKTPIVTVNQRPFYETRAKSIMQSPALLLTSTELHDLTGYTRPSRQIAWLHDEGFTFRVAADGHPRVDRAHYLKMMGAVDIAARRRTAPDFSSLRA